MLENNKNFFKVICCSLTFFLSSFGGSQASNFSPEDLQAALAGLTAIQKHEPEIEAQRPSMAGVVSLADLERFKATAKSVEAGSATAALRDKRPRTSSALFKAIKAGPTLSTPTEHVSRPKAVFTDLSEHYAQASRDLLVGFRRDEYIAGNLLQLRLDGRITGGYEINGADLDRVAALIDARGDNRNKVIADLRVSSRALSRKLQDEKKRKKDIIIDVAKRGEGAETLSEQLLIAPPGGVFSFVMATIEEASESASTTATTSSDVVESELPAAMTRSMSMMFDTAPAETSSDVVAGELPAAMTRSMSMMFDTVPVDVDAVLTSSSAVVMPAVSHATQMSLDNTSITVQEEGAWEKRPAIEAREATDTLPAKAAHDAYTIFVPGSVKRVKATEETVLPPLFFTVDASIKKGWTYNTYMMDVGIVGEEAGYVFVGQAEEEIGVSSDKKVAISRAYNILHKETTIFSASKKEKVRY